MKGFAAACAVLSWILLVTPLQGVPSSHRYAVFRSSRHSAPWARGAGSSRRPHPIR